MKIALNTFLALGLIAATGGCQPDRPHDYGQQRPDVTSLHPDDRGLQSKDVVEASDDMTMKLLKLPELNDSRTRWTIVATGMENASSDSRAQYDIFIQRLKVNLAEQGRGRVQLLENKDRFHYLQSRELAQPGERSAPPGPAGIQPQFALHGEVNDLPNRANNYYLFQFNLTDLRSREIVWSGKYEVKVAR